MSKYEPLWKLIEKHGENKTTLTFSEIRAILGFELDHSFLNHKRELNKYGYEIAKISIKGKTVRYKKYRGNAPSRATRRRHRHLSQIDGCWRCLARNTNFRHVA